MVKNLMRAKLFLVAPNEQKLVEEMLKNNILHETMFGYEKPDQKKDGTWVVWFDADIDKIKGLTRG